MNQGFNYNETTAFNFDENDYKNFVEFWKLYNYNVGPKFVRVAKGLLKSKTESYHGDRREGFANGLFQEKVVLNSNKDRHSSS